MADSVKDKISGVLEVGFLNGEVIINHPDLKPDENGVGHIVFSPNQARNLARLLMEKANDAENDLREQELRERAKNAPPVDRSQRQLVNGSPVTDAEDHKEINPQTGQQKDYIVLSPEERAKGFVRPVRNTYVHKRCGTQTSMVRAIAETLARDPQFYTGGFCCACKAHFPLAELVWLDGEAVGS